MGKISIAVVLLAIIASPAGAITFQTLDDPLGITGLTGISGDNITGVNGTVGRGGLSWARGAIGAEPGYCYIFGSYR